MYELLCQVRDKQIELGKLRAACKERKSLELMKNIFVKEVGCDTWEQAQVKFPLHATTDQLQRFTGQAFINGLPSPALQHHCQKALKSILPSEPSNTEPRITVVNKIIEEQEIQIALINLSINDFDSTVAAKVTPKFSGFPLTITTILGTVTDAEEKVCMLLIKLLT